MRHPDTNEIFFFKKQEVPQDYHILELVLIFLYINDRRRDLIRSLFQWSIANQIQKIHQTDIQYNSMASSFSVMVLEVLSIALCKYALDLRNGPYFIFLAF